MKLSNKGEIARSELLKTFEIRKCLKLHDYVIMPNHVHLLMEIRKVPINIDSDVVDKSGDVSEKSSDKIKKCRDEIRKCRDVRPNVSTKIKYFSKISPKGNSISNIVKQFKSMVTYRINPKTVFFGWQSRFYDNVIFDEKEYFVVKNYIQNNVANWEKDKFFRLG